MSEMRLSIGGLMAEIEKCRPDDQRPFVTYPMTREEAEIYDAEKRADARRDGVR